MTDSTPKAHVPGDPGAGSTRVGLVGLGRIGQTHLDAIGAAAGVTLTALVEPRQAAAAPIAEQKKARWFADHGSPELLDLVDAVVIATPPNTHRELATYFLGKGKHVLCEKPLAITSTDARAMTAAAAAAGRVLMMASKFRYCDDVVKTKALLEAGTLGKVVVYENVFSGKVLMKDRWNAQKAVAGGGVLMDNGTHSVDIARYLLGPLVSVQAQAGPYAQELEVEDTARLQFKTAGGAIGLIDLSWTIQKETDAYISIYGSQGTLIVGWKGSRFKQDGSADWVPFGAGYEKVGTLRRQLENFVETAAGRAAPLITTDDAVASVEAIEAAYASMDRDLWTSVGGGR